MHTAPKWEIARWNMQTNRYGWINKYLKVWSSLTHHKGLAGDSPTSLFTEGFEIGLSGEAPQRFLSKTPDWNQIPFYFPSSQRLRSKDMGLHCLLHANSTTARPMSAAGILLYEVFFNFHFTSGTLLIFQGIMSILSASSSLMTFSFLLMRLFFCLFRICGDVMSQTNMYGWVVWNEL